jgi:hypothetical protein
MNVVAGLNPGPSSFTGDFAPSASLLAERE